MVSINNLSVEFSARPLFDNVSFVVNKTDKIALTGKNGAGKSTLLKIIAGLQQPASGSVAMPDGLTVGYLPQQMEVADETTLLNEVKKSFGSQIDRQEEADRVASELSERDDYDSDSYHRLIERLEYLNERIAMESAGNMDAEIERTLLGLGFVREDFHRPTREFSGGWRMRVELAKILLRRPDIILLDEPTNHLDIESIQWLEQFLQQKAKAVMLVSHDRAFIDNVCRRTLEISCGKIYDYKVNYSQFVELRKERVEQQMRAYENQQKQIADIKEFVERFRYKPSKAAQVQSRIKQLDKMVPIEVDEVDNSRLRLKFPPAPRSGDYPLILENVGKAYGGHQVFDHAEFTIKRGEKVAFVGKNGEGKSTLVKCIMGEIPFTGNLRTGHNVKIGYFAQNQAQLLDGESTVFDTIDRVAVGDVRTKIRDILGAFMFGGEASDKKVKVLSGGERARLAMARMMLEPRNLLVLDEPTNHMDMRSKDILKSAIMKYDGTVVVVSHDREFLDGMVDKVYEFRDGAVKEYLGGIYYFLEKRKLESLQEIERHDAPERSKGAPEKSGAASGKLSYEQKKEQEKLVRKLRKAVETIEAGLADIERQIADYDTKFAAATEYNEADYKAYNELKARYDHQMHEWEKASYELEITEEQ